MWVKHAHKPPKDNPNDIEWNGDTTRKTFSISHFCTKRP